MRYGNPSKKDRTVSSLKGHTIIFPGRGTIGKSDLPPGDPKYPERAAKLDSEGVIYLWVPPAIRAEVEQAGMEPEGEIAEEDERPGVVRPADPQELQKAVFDAFDILVAGNQREDFAGNGAPKPAAVAKLLGYPLTNSEVKDFWPKYQASKEA